MIAVYYTTKSYVISFSESVANELKGTGVTVTTLCPGATESSFATAADMEQSKLIKNLKLQGSKTVAGPA